MEQLVYDSTANGKAAQFMVLLTQQADLSRAYSIKDQHARGWYVHNTLRDFADRTQAPVRNTLTRLGASYTHFWVANVLLVQGDRSVVDALADTRR